MPKISLSGPAELLTAIPFHLGFRPERSVVALCFHGRRLGLVARLDAVPSGAARDAAEQVAPSLLREAPSSVLLVGFDTDDGESRPLLDALRRVLPRVCGVGPTEVAERLVVRDGRWYGIDCDCCPAPGLPLPRGVDVPAVAGYVAAGGTVLDSRVELCRVLEPAGPATPAHDERARAIDEWCSRWAGTAATGERPREPGRPGARPSLGVSGHRTPLVRATLTAWGALVRGDLDDRLGLGAGAVRSGPPGGGLEAQELARIVAPLVDARLRDLLIAWLCPGTVPLDALPSELVGELREVLGPVPAAGSPGRSEVLGRVAPDETVGGVLDGVLGAPADATADGRGDAADDAWQEWQEADATRVLLSRLEALCRLTPVAHAVPLLSLVAAYAWWCGDGARASVAVDRALELEPGHRLSELIRRSLDHGLRLRAAG